MVVAVVAMAVMVVMPVIVVMAVIVAVAFMIVVCGHLASPCRPAITGQARAHHAFVPCSATYWCSHAQPAYNRLDL
jgi:hypothetical protein